MKEKKILIVFADFYKDISSPMLSAVEEYNFDDKHEYFFEVINVPGVFEIPVTIARYMDTFDGFVALGCVIKGKTPHFDFISSSTTDAIMKLSIENKKPIGNGIITCLNLKQALARRKKGHEAAAALLSVLDPVKTSTE